VIGWHYVYGGLPATEASLAIQRVKQYGLDCYVIDAEGEYKGRRSQASTFMAVLRAGLPDVSIGLSSYRFPSLHPELPWVEFRGKCDFDMPQVYWMLAHNAGEQLRRSLAEIGQMTPRLPYIPTGAAFREHGWQPTVAEVVEFMNVATQELGLGAYNFWEWQQARSILPDVWDAIAEYGGEPQPPPPSPARVAINTDKLNVRSAPVVADSTLVGHTYRDKVWEVTGEVLDVQGRTWFRSGPTAHLAGWLCREL